MKNRPHIVKEIIKKNDRNREPVAQICSSANGQYFLENVSDDHKESQVHLWKTDPLHLIKTFDTYNRGQFSPQNNYIIMYHETRNENAINIKPCLYSIEHDTSTPLADNKD